MCEVARVGGRGALLRVLEIRNPGTDVDRNITILTMLGRMWGIPRRKRDICQADPAAPLLGAIASGVADAGVYGKRETAEG